MALNRVSAPLGTHNAVLRGNACVHYVKDFEGPLSIKSVTAGTVAWKCGGRELPVDRGSFLVLQDGEPYSLDIESRTPVGTLCVFFQRGFVESAGGPGIEGEPAAVPFLPRLHPGDDRILPRMHTIADSVDADRLWLDGQFVELARDLLLLNRDLAGRLRRMPARRPATREELFRRVRRGQEILHADPAGDWGLAEIARASCLSPFHFHRTFTLAFGQTPHQYRNALRLERAQRLLESTAMTVTEICGAVGFESAPSFTNLYRRAFGAPPTAARKMSKSR